MKILIADDHPLFRAALQQVLEQAYPDATLHTAANVPELQQQAEAIKALDLLLLDLHMPGALGFSALSWFLGHYPQIPVVMISANSHPETVRRAIDHGAAAFMSKSVDVDIMQDCLSRVTRGGNWPASRPGYRSRRRQPAGTGYGGCAVEPHAAAVPGRLHAGGGSAE